MRTVQRWGWSLVGVLLVACGAQPEQIVVPTQAVIEQTTVTPLAIVATPTAPAATAIPTLPPIPVITGERDVVPQEGFQVLAVAQPGSVIEPEGFVPGEVYVFTPFGSTLYRLTLNPAQDREAIWAPGSGRIFFSSDRENNTFYLYSLSVNDRNPIQRLDPFSSGDQREPALSPDGLTLLFTSNRGGADALYSLFAGDGRGTTQITFNATRDYQANWSPDATWITFTSERDGNPEIYIMDRTGGGLQRLTDHPSNDNQPVFSPDGRRLAFISDRNGSPQVYIMALPQPFREFDERSNDSEIDLAAGIIPPLELDPAAPPPSVYAATTGRAIKSSPSWYLTETYRAGLIYTETTLRPDGTRYSEIYRANDDGSNAQVISPPGLSFAEGRAR